MPLGGVSTSAPAAVARRGVNLLDLTVRGSDNAIHFRSFQAGAGWSGWFNLTGGHAINSQDPGVVNIWHRATDGQLAQKPWTGTAWRDFEFHGGSIVGAPSVVSREQNMVDVFVRGAGRALYQKHWQGGVGWLELQLIDAKPIDSTPVAVSDTAGHVRVVPGQRRNRPSCGRACSVHGVIRRQRRTPTGPGAPCGVHAPAARDRAGSTRAVPDPPRRARPVARTGPSQRCAAPNPAYARTAAAAAR